MGEMTRELAVKILEEQNRSASREKIIMYADAYMDYMEAQRNIKENGALVTHPKTGAPFDNPYLKIRQQMATAIGALRLKSDPLWYD
jgi:phage terminase small subunit